MMGRLGGKSTLSSNPGLDRPDHPTPPLPFTVTTVGDDSSSKPPGSPPVPPLTPDITSERLKPKISVSPSVILVPSAGEPWRSGLFDCCQHPLNAIITTVAPCVTFGQIAEILDNGSTSCLMGALLYVVSFVVCNWRIGIHYRRRMRTAFQIAETPITDMSAHFIFCFCALCQEFRELDYRGLDPFRGYRGLAAGMQDGQNQPATENSPPAKQFMTKDNHGGPPRCWQERVVNAMPEASPPLAVASTFPHAHKGDRTPRSPNPPPPFTSSNGGSGSNHSASEQPCTPLLPGIILAFPKSTFTYEELSLATDGFSRANLLGEGGFGLVHKGMLPNGKEIAVKKLKAGSGQGEREFQAEVETINRVHHRHLVSLVGYCIAEHRHMLVYEFVPNKTLQFHLHAKGRPTMDWPTRLKIALGSAKGLSYLHEDCSPKIIHRDIKAANILLDFKFEVKVADFGLAKFILDANTHVSTRVMGTFGYLAPEYASTGKLNEKSDVFSFGVVLLELITGRRPVDRTNTEANGSLVGWARPRLIGALKDGDFDPLVDPKLQNKFNHGEMVRMVSCAAACLDHSARERPRMSQIVRALEGDASLPSRNDGIRPGQGDLYSFFVSSEDDETSKHKYSPR